MAKNTIIFYKKVNQKLETAALIQIIQESEMTEEMKKALIPVVQVGDKSIRQKVYDNVQAYNKKIYDLRNGKIKFTPAAIRYMVQATRENEKKEEEKKENLKKEISVLKK